MPAQPPTAFPTDAAAWPDFLATTVDASLDDARALVATLKDGTPRTTAEVLALWNDADVALGSASAAAHLLAEVHPDAELRAAAEERAQAAEDLGISARQLEAFPRVLGRKGKGGRVGKPLHLLVEPRAPTVLAKFFDHPREYG